jgi:Tfp pilus assembly protein PilO
MIDKKVIVILLLLVVYIFFVKPKAENIEPLVQELALYQKKITKEQYLKENKDEILKDINKMLEFAEKNKEKFFPPETNNSEALGQILEFLKLTAINDNVEFLTSQWGEPVEDETGNFLKLPLSVVVRGYPEDINKYLQDVYSYKKLIKIDKLSTSIYRNEKINLSFSTTGYKLIKKEKE